MDSPKPDRIVRVLNLYNNNGLLDPSTQVCASARAIDIMHIQVWDDVAAVFKAPEAFEVGAEG